MKVVNRIAAVLCLIMPFAAGCIGVDSEHPVTPVKDAMPFDKGLVGTWISTVDGTEIKWKISSAGDGFPNSMYRFEALDDPKEDAICLFYVSKVGDFNCVNFANYDKRLPTKWDPSKVDYYSVFAIERSGDELTAIGTDNKFLVDAVNKGQLKGLPEPNDGLDIEFEFEPELDEDDLHLANTTAELNAFIKKQGKKFFGGKRHTMKRQK